jgi:hypothetical protein
LAFAQLPSIQVGRCRMDKIRIYPRLYTPNPPRYSNIKLQSMPTTQMPNSASASALHPPLILSLYALPPRTHKHPPQQPKQPKCIAKMGMIDLQSLYSVSKTSSGAEMREYG